MAKPLNHRFEHCDARGSLTLVRITRHYARFACVVQRGTVWKELAVLVELLSSERQARGSGGCRGQPEPAEMPNPAMTPQRILPWRRQQIGGSALLHRRG